MSYHEQSWGRRFGTLGDAAEHVFEEVAPFGTYERFGWNRPAVGMQKMGPFLRHAPDYYCQPGILVEVMGCGKDGVVKLKVEKWAALREWNQYNEVALFVWNSSAHEWYIWRWDDLKAAVRKARKDESEFHDGNRYFPIPWPTSGGMPYGHG